MMHGEFLIITPVALAMGDASSIDEIEKDEFLPDENNLTSFSVIYI